MFPDNDLSDTAYVAGFNFPVKQLTFADMKKDWEMGGIALNDPSAGLEYQLWEFTLEVDESTGDSDVYVEAPSIPKTLLFSGSFITEIAGCFDQNMNPMVAYTESGTPKIWWWDPTIPGMTYTSLPAGSIDLRCTLDDKRQFNVADSDIVLSYVRAGALYFRLQRERYLTEHLLFDEGSVERLISLAMNNKWRLQWRLRGQSGAAHALSVSEPFLGDIVYDLHRRSGILPEHIDVSDLYRASDIVPGLKVAVEQGMDKPIDWLMEIFQFTKSKRGRRIVYEHKGGEVKARIPYSHLVIDGVEQGLAPERVDPLKLPKKVNVNHIDSTGGFAKNKQTASRRSNLITSDEELNVDTNVVLTPDQAATAALTIIKAKHGEMFTYKFSTTIRYTEIMAADVVEVEDSDGFWHRMRIDERNEDDGVIEWEATFDAGPLTYVSSLAAGSALDPPVSTTPGNIGETDLQIFNMPVQRDQDDELVLYIGARGAGSGWGGYTLYYSIDAGVSYSPAFTSELPSNIGELVNTISDSATTFDVLVPYPLESVTASQIAAGENRAFIGDEEIQYQTATLVGMVDGMYHYTVSGAVRGVLRTAKEAWSGGIRFVPYDSSIVTLQLQREHYGVDFYYKAVSTGQSIDDVDPIAYLFDYAASQTEWPVSSVLVATNPNGTGVLVSWTPSPRLGTFGEHPYESKHFTGYRLKFSDGFNVDVPKGTSQYVYAGATASVNVVVWSLNDITGESAWADGSGNGSGTGGTPPDGNVLYGTFPEGYVGSCYRMFDGDNGVKIRGSSDIGVGLVSGPLFENVSAWGYATPNANLSGISGTPLSAGSKPVQLHITDAVDALLPATIAVNAKPTYTMLDLRWHDMTGPVLVATSPSWTTYKCGVGLRDLLPGYQHDGQMWSRTAVNSGKIHAECTMTGDALYAYFGLNFRYGETLTESQNAVGFSNEMPTEYGFAIKIHEGTYALEYDCATGDYSFYRDGVGVVASGTVAIPSGKFCRIGWACAGAGAQGPVSFKMNYGNEAWILTPTSGYGGILFDDVAVPVGFKVSEPNVICLAGRESSSRQYIVSGDYGGSPSYLEGTFGLSSGKHAFLINRTTRGGLVKSGFDSSDDMGISGGDAIAMTDTELTWRFGGVNYSVPVSFAGYSAAIGYAVDFAAGTVKVYKQDITTQALVLEHTITGLPAGTWIPAQQDVSGSGYVVGAGLGVAGYDDWAVAL